jgi:O-antigen biosynthesis protein
MTQPNSVAQRGDPTAEPSVPRGLAAGLVSVVIPCVGQLEYTSLCVPAVLRFTRRPFDVVFLDGGSLDGTAEYLAGVAAAAPTRVEVTHVGPEPGAAGAARPNFQVRGEAVVLLSNDTIVTEGWLDRLLAVADTDPLIGMAAPMSNYAPGPQLVHPVSYRLAARKDRPRARNLELPDILQQLQTVNGFARSWRDGQPSEPLEVEGLGGGCVLIRRDVLKDVGFSLGLSSLGFFDVAGLGLRLRQNGYRLACARQVYVHHFGSRTSVSRS